MSIKGLWRILKHLVRDGHLSQFRGQRVAVDMYVWLHRAVINSVTINTENLLPYLYAKLVKGDATATIALEDVLVVTDQYLTSVMDKVHHLQRFGIVPVCVFDGTEMPMKQGTDEERQARRDAAFQKAMRHFEDAYSVEHATLRSPSHSLSEGIRELEKAVDISTEMAHTVIQILREERGVECLVAPYEADAQLSYLCREGYVQAALSEDSDLIAYFCPCVISKLDKSGRCDVVKPPDIIPGFFAELNVQLRARRGAGGAYHTQASPAAILPPHSPSFRSPNMVPPPPQGSGSGSGYTYESFLLGCVLAGCDYVRSLHGIGITKAFRLVCQSQSLTQLMRTLHDEYGFPDDELHRYRQKVLSAFYCFAHHIVYCPRQKQLTLFHPLPHLAATQPSLKTDLVGYLWPPEVARKVCEECLYDPCTHRLYRGTFQRCVEQYMRRTHHGQVSLRSFSGFEALSSAKVVVRGRAQETGASPRHDHHPQLVGVKVTRHASSEEEEANTDEEAFGRPLRRVRRVSGFLSSGGVTSSTSLHTGLRVESQDAAPVIQPLVPSRALVRSKYFLMRTAVIGGDDADTEDPDEDEDGDESEDESSDSPLMVRVHDTNNPSSPSSPLAAADVSAPPCSSSSSAEREGLERAEPGQTVALNATSHDDMCSIYHHAPSHISAARDQVRSRDGADPSTSLPLSPSTLYTVPSLSSPSPTDSTCTDRATDMTATTVLNESLSHASAVNVNTRTAGEAVTATCACPFDYWQCNQAHSIFIQCFQGKAWVRGRTPPAARSSTRPVSATQDTTEDDDASSRTSDSQCEPDAHTRTHSTTRRADAHGDVSGRTGAPHATRASLSVSSLPSSETSDRYGSGNGVHVVGAFRPPRTVTRPSALTTEAVNNGEDASSPPSAHDSHRRRSPIRVLDENTEHRAHCPATTTAASTSTKTDATSLFESLTFSKS